MIKKPLAAAVIIALFSLVQLLFITQPSSLVFDEQYYVKTARLMVRGYPDYNVEHPPLGKQLIATSMRFLGDNPWGWRVPSVLFSIASLVLVFVFAKKFLGETVALLATALLVLDPLWIAMSRLALLDIPATFFAVFSFVVGFYYVRNPRLKLATAAGAILGLSLAVKWSAIFLPFFFILIFSATRYLQKIEKRALVTHVVGFFCALLVVYLLAYLPSFKNQGEGLSLIDRHLATLTTHSGVKSRFDKLPDLNPLLWFTAPTFGATPIFADRDSAIVLFFNPISGWVFLLSVFFLIKRVVKNLTKGRLEDVFLILAVFFLYLLWLANKRPAYIYHIFPLLPFVYLIQARFGAMLLKRWGWGRILFASYLAISFLLTAALLPYLLGLPLTSSYYSAALFFLALTFALAVLALGVFAPKKIESFLKNSSSQD
jgi:predicted membrane-bound dolichyl-phosphate-mannose-protein mannosyltransferase